MFLNAINWGNYGYQYRLTVTKVVFEFELKYFAPPRAIGLTVTKVVFEFNNSKVVKFLTYRLTVTKVVFEYDISQILMILGRLD